MKIKYSALFLFVLVLFACSSDDAFMFSGITSMNENAIPNGEVDESDWQIDETWTDLELSLFPDVGPEALNNEGVPIDLSLLEFQPSITPAYPNPNSGSFNFRSLDIDFQDSQMVIVNSNYEILAGPISLNVNSELNFNFELASNMASFLFQGTAPEVGDGPSIQSGQIVRMYYYFRLQEQDVFLKGHGDILFE